MTMIAFLPPNSRQTFFKVGAASAATRLPASVLPVKVTTLIAGCATRDSPTALPGPVTMFSTPGGNPASSKRRTNSIARTGVSDAGLKTTVLPATRAGRIFQLGIAMGKFHGVTTATTPTGSRNAMPNLSGNSTGAV